MSDTDNVGASRSPSDWTRTLRAALSKGRVPGELKGSGPAARRDAAAFITQIVTKRKAGHANCLLESFTALGGKRLMRLAIINDDMPFLVDSVAAIIAQHGLHATIAPSCCEG